MSERVPEGWRKIKLGEVGKFSTSSVDKKISIDEQEVFLLNYMDVYNHSILTGNYPFQRVTAPTKQISSSSVQQGDVFFTPSSETPDDVGHSAVFIGDKKNLVHSYHTVRFRPSSDVYLDDEFKSYAFKGEKTYEYFRKRATGSTRFTVSLPVFNDLEITIPPLPEQKKIASILTSVDEVIETTQKQIDKLQDLKKGTMNELLTKGIGHTEFKESELGRIPKSWEVKNLGDLCEIKHGFAFDGAFFTTKPNDFVLLTPGNFHVDGSLYYGEKTKYFTGSISEDYILENGDLLVVMTDLTKEMAILGNTVILQSNLVNLHNQRIGKILKKDAEITSKFLHLLFNSFPVKNLIRTTATGTTVRHTSPSKILEATVAVPMPNEQEKICNVENSLTLQIRVLRNKLHQTQSLKKSLMQDLLTGKVRVSVN